MRKIYSIHVRFDRRAYALVEARMDKDGVCFSEALRRIILEGGKSDLKSKISKLFGRR